MSKCLQLQFGDKNVIELYFHIGYMSDKDYVLEFRGEKPIQIDTIVDIFLIGLDRLNSDDDFKNDPLVNQLLKTIREVKINVVEDMKNNE